MQNLPEQMKGSSPIYSTADLGVAVFIFTLGHELIKTSVINGRRLVFHFHRKEDTDALVARYINGTGKAPAKKLFENYRALRGMAFSQTDNLR